MSDEKKKRQYTMTPAALQQRRNAAEKSTGPTTEAGKAIVSRNAWRHGQYAATQGLGVDDMLVGAFAKPCKSTCRKHPSQHPEHPCPVVMEGLTQPGGDCLDKTVYVNAFNDILAAMQSGSAESMHATLAGQLAGAIEVIQNLRESIATDGIVIKIPLATKSGDVYGHKPAINPALPMYLGLLEKLGLNLPELMVTPRALEKAGDQENAESAIAELFGRALSRAGGTPVRRPVTVEGATE